MRKWIDLFEDNDQTEWFRWMWGAFFFNIDKARRLIASGEVKADIHTVPVKNCYALLGFEPEEYASNNFEDDRASIDIMSAVRSRAKMKNIPDDKMEEPAIIVMWDTVDAMERAGLPLKDAEPGKPSPIIIDGNHRLARLFLEGEETALVHVVPYKEALKFTHDRNHEPIVP